MRRARRHTLKAMGVWLTFLILRIWDTSVGKGPAPVSEILRRAVYQRTVEAQLLGINLDRHCGSAVLSRSCVGLVDDGWR